MVTEKRQPEISDPRRRDSEGDGADTRRLIKRMAMAAAMILLLLGGLAVFDHYSTDVSSETTEPQFTAPVPVPKKLVAQSLPDTENQSDAKKPAMQAEPEASAPPKDAKSPDLPARPEVLATPATAVANGGASRAAGQVKMVPTGASISARDPLASGQAAVKPTAREASPNSATPESPTASSQPTTLAQAEEPQPQPSKTTGALVAPRLMSGFALQAGVFGDPRRAEDLRDRIAQAGIPVTIESRVEVGPFKNKAEASAARAKLKALGIDAMLLPIRKEVRH